MSASSITRMYFRFYGRVQGVGFRYKVSYLASRGRLTGWVENDYDGSVRVELQGPKEEITRVLEALYTDRYIQIEDYTSRTIPPEEEERGFHIRG